MPHYKLTYFDFRGRAEIARLMFAYAGKEYEDHRIQVEDWSAVKPNTPFGQIPVLEVDGEEIGQSVAIANYLAREFGLYGKTNMESCQIDQVVCLIQDLINAFVKAMFEIDPAKKAEMMRVNNEEVVPRFLGFFESILKKNGTGFFVGSDITLADFFIYDSTWNLIKSTPTLLDNFPNLKQHRDRIGSVPQIKAHVDARKPTEH
ncbi:hypothetical protein EGW08_007732 [Elysia chlorotica]|uniref:Glutathione transferase n=1 Tax=Elysia chlorotica TaxID=188477 RepID=A0A3S0ZS31_ELYCH|nr:hypothetical protein EGW08_007732 [Elysia chlorotica]